MLFFTHVVFAFLLGIISLKLIDITNIPLFIAFIFIGSIVPDIDNPNSRLGRKLPVISHLIKFTLGHRGIFHSLWPLFLISFLLSSINIEISIGLFIGYLSHLFLDALTISGVRFLYPLKFRIKGFISTGSLIEKFFLFLVVLSVLIIILTTIY